ncbi:MAG: type IV pilus assembly protein PilM [Phycisphaerales bacterium]|nr:type IV pilus assembly protein PilM [Phycisphaerales bacterium]
MAGNKSAWGIEVGSYAVKAMRLERTGDEVQIMDFAYVPHKKPLSTPDLDVDEMVRLTLGQLMSQKSIEGERVVMSIEGRSSFSRFAKLPPVEAKKIPDIVKFEAVQQIPFPIEEVEWDSKTFLSEDSPETEVGIFAIRRDELERRLALWAEHGLTPDVVTVGPVALFNAVHYDLQAEPTSTPVVTLDIGTSASDLVVADGEQCWIRTFPIGGSDFTEAIAESFKLSYSKAERLKRDSATSKYAKQIMQAMRPVFGDLLQDVQRSLSHYENQHRGAQLNTVLGVGSTFKIPGLRKFLGQQLQVGVGRLDEFRRIRVEGRMAADFASHTVNMATAYGLALQGVGLAEIEVNLNPAHAVREQMWARKTKWFVAAAGVAVAASALLFVRPIIDRAAFASGQAEAANDLNSVVNQGKKHKGKLDELARSNNLGFTATNMERLLDDREIWPHLMHDAISSVASAGAQPELLSSDLEKIKSIPAGSRRLAMLEDLQGSYSVDGKDRYIDVEMQVAFSNSDIRGFLNNTVADWLRDHAEREGVPYVIMTDSIDINPEDLQPVTVTESGEEKKEGRRNSSTPAGRDRGGSSTGFGTMGGSGGGGGGQQPGRRKPPVGEKINTNAGPPGGGFGTAGGEGFNNADDNFGSESGRDRGFGLGGRGSNRGNSRDSGSEAGLVNLGADAPIPGAPSMYSPGDTFHIGRVTFRVKLIDPKATPNGGA